MAGFTQERISEICGLSVSQLSRVERGISFPSADFLKRIASALNVGESDLLRYAASAALNETNVSDKSLRGIIKAMKDTLANNHNNCHDEDPVCWV